MGKNSVYILGFVMFLFLSCLAARTEAEYLKYKDPKQPVSVRIKDAMSKYFTAITGSVLSGEESVPAPRALAQAWVDMVKGCVRAIDGTHIKCIVPLELQVAFHNRKVFTGENVMAIVDFELTFTYLLPGWEGSIHDGRVLHDTVYSPPFRFPHIPPGYANKLGFLAPYRGQNYHLHDQKQEYGDHKKELFNYRHASLCNAIERTFGIWKNKFYILKGVSQYSIKKQRDIIIARAIFHNFIKLYSDEELIFKLEDEQVSYDNNDQNTESSTQQQNEDGHDMEYFRDELVDWMWNDRHHN